MMRSTPVIAADLALGVFVSGCATKKQVRAEVDRGVSTAEGRVETVEGRVGEVEETGRRNAAELRRIEAEAKGGINEAKSRAEVARNTAENAQGKTDQLARQMDQEVSRLDTRIGEFDKFVLAKETTIYFQTGKWDLTPQAAGGIDTLIKSIADREGYRIEIQGFTDSTGSVGHNQRLSQSRAEAVLRYLVEHHDVPVFRVGIVGLGKNKPASDNHTSRGRAENRRVEIRLYANTATRGSAESEPRTRPSRVSNESP